MTGAVLVGSGDWKPVLMVGVPVIELIPPFAPNKDESPPLEMSPEI